MTELRPLTVGEMLDRAVTLTVKNLLLFGLICLVWAAFYVAVLFGSLRLLAALGLPTSGTQTIVVFGPMLAIVWFAWICTTVALMYAANARYLGRAIAFTNAYRESFPRLLPFIGYCLAWVGLFLVLALPVGLVLAALVFAAHFAGIVLAILLVFFLAAPVVIVASIFSRVPYLCGGFRCVVEKRGPIQSFNASLENELSRELRGRTFLVGLVYMAIEFGLGISVSMISALQFVFQNAFGIALVTAGEFLAYGAIAIYLNAFAVILYYDMRLRGEGLDLQLSALRATGTA